MIYEFFCECGHVTEVITSDYNMTETQCKECGAPAKKGLSWVNGKGWDHWSVIDEVREQVSKEE